MAAKVVMVAVPGVLGIASIKVHPADVNMEESLSLDKLSIYTPLPPTHRPQFIDEQPGALQRSLSSLRVGLLPYIQTAQGACVSWKNVTVNLYHGSLDVYYFLKDPPPGFLPRLGSIYLAGLVGMLVTRNGSRLRRIVVPTSLMAAGVSVCFPAQTVTLLKVTGRKLQAAGQWSGATVSSLLSRDSAPSQAAKEPAPSQAAKEPARSGPEEEEEEEPPGSGPAPPHAGHAPPAQISDSELLAAFLVAVPPIPPDPAAERPGISPDPVMMDYGQSNPEDSDMYSTRS